MSVHRRIPDAALACAEGRVMTQLGRSRASAWMFAYSIAADQQRPSEGDGFVRAETIRQAVALIGHPEVNV